MYKRQLEGFANAEKPHPGFPKRGAIDSYVKSQLQAKIQLKGRKSGQPEFEFNEVEKDRGFLRLPEPSEGDVFFDIEGNPRASINGLEYLLGYVTGEGEQSYRATWGLRRLDEKQSFETFIDEMVGIYKAHPAMHIYHYAPYEPAALKRLATRHATREVELDHLLRGKVFVDLFGVTRQAIRASVESYSIKQLEQFYGYQRLEVLADASKSLREMERCLELDQLDQITDEHKRVVETYNKDDCMSTLAVSYTHLTLPTKA